MTLAYRIRMIFCFSALVRSAKSTLALNSTPSELELEFCGCTGFAFGNRGGKALSSLPQFILLCLKSLFLPLSPIRFKELLLPKYASLYWISFKCSIVSRKNLSSSPFWLKMHLARYLRLFTSLVFILMWERMSNGLNQPLTIGSAFIVDLDISSLLFEEL